MKVIHNLNYFDNQKLPNPVVTIGMFDGVHLGHRKIITHTVNWARKIQGTSIVVTFDKHPENVLSTKKHKLITSTDHKLALIETLGVDSCVLIRFNKHLSQTAPKDFIESTLCGKIHAKGIVIGENSTFGKGGSGNAALLRKCAEEYHYEVRVIPLIQKKGETISSTNIRMAIHNGDLEKASAMLGRRFSLFGVVTHCRPYHNEKDTLVFNFYPKNETLPPEGVYRACIVAQKKKEATLLVEHNAIRLLISTQEGGTIKCNDFHYEVEILDKVGRRT